MPPLLLLAAPIASAAPRLNELLPDPTGADVGYEWIELVTDDDGDADLSGYVLERYDIALQTWLPIYTFPAGAGVAGDSPLVVGESLVAEADLVAATQLHLEVSATEAVGVRLVDAGGGVVDTVLYGGANLWLLAEDSGAVPPAGAPNPAEGLSVARVADGVDTDASVADWTVADPPTPGVHNAAPVGIPTDSAGEITGDTGLQVPVGRSVVVNEVLLGTGAWLELLNVGSAADVAGWRVQVATDPATGFVDVATLPGGVLATGQRFVLCGDGSGAGCDHTEGRALPLSVPADGVALRLADAAGQPVDTVVFGTNNVHGWTEDDGTVAVPVAAPAAGSTLARLPDGTDTDRSTVDFGAALPSPGSANSIAGGPTGDTGLLAGPHVANVVINELLPRVSGVDIGYEWLEVANRTSGPVLLLDWTIEVAASGGWAETYRFPDVVLPPHVHWLVGDELVAGADLSLASGDTLGLGEGVELDGIRLRDSSGRVVDTVLYGDGSNLEGLDDDLGEIAVAGTWTGAPADDHVLFRSPDGVDSNVSAVDFAIVPVTQATPGTHNDGLPVATGDTGLLETGAETGLEPLDTGTPAPPSPAPHVIVNEVVPVPLADGEAWIELVNDSAWDVDLASFVVERGSGSGWETAVALPPSELLLPPGGRLVLAEENAAIAGAHVLGPGERLGLGDGLVHAAGVRVVSRDGRPLDTVLWGCENSVLEDDRDLVPQTLAEPPLPGDAVARIPDQTDTDRAADLARAVPSPGSANDGTAVVDTGYVPCLPDTGATGDTGVAVPTGLTAVTGDTGSAHTAHTADTGTAPPTDTSDTGAPPEDPPRVDPSDRRSDDERSGGGCGCDAGGTGASWLAALPGLLWLRRRVNRAGGSAPGSAGGR